MFRLLLKVFECHAAKLKISAQCCIIYISLSQASTLLVIHKIDTNLSQGDPEEEVEI